MVLVTKADQLNKVVGCSGPGHDGMSEINP